MSLSHKILSFLGNNFKTFNSFLNLPQDHFDKTQAATTTTTNTSTIKIYLRSYRRGDTPKRLIWLVPGGPGEDGHFWEHQIGEYFETDPAFESTWIYLADHRGLGKSSRVRGKRQAGACLANVEDCLKDVRVPLRVLTPAQAASDLAMLVELVRDDLQAHEGGIKVPPKIYAIGQGYGSSLIYRVVLERGSLFDGGVLLIDLIIPGRSYPANVGSSLIRNCHASPFCRRQFPETNAALQTISRLLSPDRNKCTRALRMRPEYRDLLVVDSRDLRPLVQYVVYAILAVLPLDWYEKRLKGLEDKRVLFHPQALALAFLKQLETCASVERFTRFLYQLAGLFEKSNILLSTNLNKPIRGTNTASSAASANQHRINEFLNIYIGYSEAASADLNRCITATPNADAFTNRCVVERVLKERWDSQLRPHAFLSDANGTNKSVKLDPAATLLVVGGAVDVQAPIDVAKAAFEQIGGAGSRRFLQIDQLGHGGLWVAGCAGKVYAALLDPTGKLAGAEACLGLKAEGKTESSTKQTHQTESSSKQTEKNTQQPYYRLVYTSCPYLKGLQLWDDMSGHEDEMDPNRDQIQPVLGWYTTPWAIFAFSLGPGILIMSMTGLLLFTKRTSQ